MNETTRALGLIEVIGYPTAITAADAALKAANVNLSTVTKVGSGIMTVQLVGDVAAIRSAVEAGAEAAKQIGTLRYTHVIPRYDSQLLGSLVKDNATVQRKEKNNGKITVDDLQNRTNSDLKNLIRAMNIPTDEQFLKTAKKEELIETIMSAAKEREGENGANR